MSSWRRFPSLNRTQARAGHSAAFFSSDLSCGCLQAVASATEQARKLLQMPPVLPERKPIDDVLSEEKILDGMDDAKYAFTDITYDIPHRVGTSVEIRTVLMWTLYILTHVLYIRCRPLRRGSLWYGNPTGSSGRQLGRRETGSFRCTSQRSDANSRRRSSSRRRTSR